MTLCRPCRTCYRAVPETELVRGRCPEHAAEYERDKSRRRRATSTATQTRDTTTWQHVRAAARARDGGCTQRHTHNCNGRLEVHHRIPLELGGQPFDLNNLETLCRRHHSQAEASFLRGDSSHPPVALRETNSEGPSIG